MTFGRVFYRLRQFWSALYAAPSADQLGEASSLLTLPQMALFRQMHRSEQAHSIQVMAAVFHASDGVPDEARRDLLRAALLHDVGKSRYPVRIWERVLIVLFKAFLPGMVERWGDGAAVGGRLAMAPGFCGGSATPGLGSANGGRGGRLAAGDRVDPPASRPSFKFKRGFRRPLTNHLAGG
jgi:hypothetical protein